MRSYLIVPIVILLFGSIALAAPPVDKVLVVNDPLNVNVQNQSLNINLAGQTQPLEVKVVDQAEPTKVCYTYWGLQSTNYGEFLQYLNDWVSQGWEPWGNIFFTSAGNLYTVAIRKPVDCPSF